MGDFSEIGKDRPRVNGEAKARGEATFISDISLHNMLTGKILRSPHPHARIVNIDTSAAEELNGVEKVITYKDTPKKHVDPMGLNQDWFILAKDKVRFQGDEVAAVAAVDEETAEEALKLIDVEYETLPYVIDPEKALEEDAPLLYEDKGDNIAFEYNIDKGDVEKAFKESDEVISERFKTGSPYQAPLETFNCMAKYERNKLTLWAPLQDPSKGAKLTYARALDMDPDKIRVKKPFVGGAFGAKLEYPQQLICSLLAMGTGSPVKMENTREEDIMAGNPRTNMTIDAKVGINEDGKINALQREVYSSNGARTVYAPAIMATACYRAETMYRLENVKSRGYSIYTNTVPRGCFRGFGNTQMLFALESILDMLSEKIGMDPAEVRRRNLHESGETTLHGRKLGSFAAKECVDKAVEEANWEEKRENKKIGVGLANGVHVSGNRNFFPAFDGSTAYVRVSENGMARIITGEADIGQGLNTVYAQIAAEELGIPLKKVDTAHVDTDIAPYGLGTWASRATLHGGNAVKKAAADAKDQLLDVASEILDVDKENLKAEDGEIFESDNPDNSVPFEEVSEQAMFKQGGGYVIGEGHYTPDTSVPEGGGEKKWNPSPAYSFGAHIAVVEVDEDTGEVDVLEYIAAHEVGKALNPMSVEGQIEGGVLQGLGWALMEDIKWEDGKIVNPNFSDYVLPTAVDSPEIKSIIVEEEDPEGPFGAKSIGEVCLDPVHAAVANAIYDATGIRMKTLPMTPEKILLKLKGKSLP